MAFLEGRLLPSQSEQFKKYSKSTDWQEKSRPSKKAAFFDHVNRLNVTMSKDIFEKVKFN